MASRSSLVVVVAASALLLASFATRSSSAVAAAPSQPWIDQIAAIQAEAFAAMDAIVAPVEARLETATTDGEARAVRDAAKDAVDDIYQLAKDDMEAVVDDSLDDPEVKDASDAAIRATDRYKSAAEDEIKAFYDEWKFRYDAPPAEEVIAELDEKLAEGFGKVANDIDHYADELRAADDMEKADEEQGKAFERLADQVRETIADLDKKLAKRPFDPIVQAAYAGDISQLQATAAATGSTIVAMHEAWVAGHFPSTTTTTTTVTTGATIATTPTTRIFPTTTTIPPITTTSPPTSATSPPTPIVRPTTTTLAPAAQLPPTEPPPPSDTAYMSDPPAIQVMAARVGESRVEMNDSEMATVSFVRRIVDTQLPAGVAVVAAGPLVVLGLILDAVLAAGTLMLVPWLVLGIYMIGLLRGTIPLQTRSQATR